MKSCQSKYSMWLIPTGKTYEELRQIIYNLSQRHSSPIFEPHITLIGKLFGEERDLVEKTRQLAFNVSPFDIRLNGLDLKYSEEYFKSLFIDIEKTPKIIAANKKAKQVFNQEDGNYRPHLSLVYGNFPMRLKNEMISEIGDNINLEFRAQKIHLFSTYGEVKNWHEVNYSVLGGKNKKTN
mgnify:CR=1 FL=1